ncbi:MAG: DUF1599 domain-containing protein [Bacteroidia bacterium]|nr:DUF1599 domain-containing protein [Bacteroidia bacterium]
MEFDEQASRCRSLFISKNKDYGTAWRILRPSSITDQILIKALRIRSIEEKGTQQIGDSIASEFTGIINYCIMGLIQLQYWPQPEKEFNDLELINLYDNELSETKALMVQKNHDYGEAWREMRASSFTDLILMKLNRTKQIEDNNGKTLVSEGIDANYRDMINYAIFALITLNTK